MLPAISPVKSISIKRRVRGNVPQQTYNSLHFEPHFIPSLLLSLKHRWTPTILSFQVTHCEELKMEKVYPVSAPTIARVMDNDAIDLERYPSTKKDAPTSSSESSPAVGSVSETPSRFQRLASSFQRRRCQRNGYAPTGPRPSIYSRIKRCLTFNRRDNAHLFRTRFSKFRENYSLFIVLFVLWATFNILGALWHYHYVQASTHPYNYRGLINNSSGWSAFTASMFIFGFILMYPNAIAGMVLIAFPFTMLKSRRQSSAPAKTMHSLVSFAVIAFACLCIASGIFVTIEPFFGYKCSLPCYRYTQTLTDNVSDPLPPSQSPGRLPSEALVTASASEYGSIPKVRSRNPP